MRVTISRLCRGHFARNGIFWGIVGCSFAFLLPQPCEVLGQDENPPIQRGQEIDARTDTAIQRGLDFLQEQQRPDGSFSGGTMGRNVGVCGIAGLAFLASGSTPGRGPHGENIDRTLDYVLTHVQRSGFISEPEAVSHGPMYGHGFATLFLAEVYGMSPREDLREKLSLAVRLIVDTQNEEGGWRYEPRRFDADISVTICQIMALRAARNAGLHVPRETVERCIDFVRRCQNPDGGFMYMRSDGGGVSAFPRSAAGLVALYSAGVYQGPEIEQGLQYLSRFQPGRNTAQNHTHYFYGQYYATQAMWHAGDAYWEEWYPGLKEELLRVQLPNGSWTDPMSPLYGTAMACIVLQIPNDCLPIFQR